MRDATNTSGVRRWMVVVGAACLAGFAALALLARVSEPVLLGVDRPVERLILSHRTAWLNRVMVGLTFMGTRWVIGGAALALLAWSLVTRRHRRLVLLIGVAVLLNPVFEVVFKVLVDRVRPAVSQLLPGNGPSFPSGHVLAAVGFYGLLPFLTREVTQDLRARVTVLLASVAIIAAVVVSRPYLDVHWTTDALGGLLLGAVLVVGTYQAFLLLPPPRPLARK